MSKISLPLEEEKIYVLAAKRNPVDFAPLYDHYYPHIRRYFAVKLISPEVIDDLTARTFERALANIQQFTYKGYPFSAWLYRIAANLLTDYFRQQSIEKTTSLESQVDDAPADESTNLQDQVIEEWQQKYIKQLLQKLPRAEQQVIYMKFYDGFTNKRIAKKLRISETNVSTIVHRIVKKLRTQMRKEFA